MGQIVNPISLEKGLRVEFMKAYEQVENGKILSAAMSIASSADHEKFGWLGSVPQMQEFIDEKSPKGLLDHNYTIKNVPFEATLKVDKFALRNDQYSMVQTRVRDLAARAKVFPIKLLMDLIVAGTTQLCYDGLAFFSASHVEGQSGTQTNIVNGTGTTLAQLTADFLSARTLMMSYLDDAGQPMFEDLAQQDLMIVCPPALQGTFQQLLNSTILPNNGTNVLYKAADLAVSSRLVDANDWYVMNRWGAVKPLVLQENMPIEFGALEGQSDEGFKRRFYLYGVEWYGNVGYGLWQKAVKVTNA
jgi:phage major head subunit gpT-like protein